MRWILCTSIPPIISRPRDAGAKAYQLLMKAMEESGYGAIASSPCHQRELHRDCAARDQGGHDAAPPCSIPMRFAAAESVPTDKIAVKEQEKKLARQLYEVLAAPFDPQNTATSIKRMCGR